MQIKMLKSFSTCSRLPEQLHLIPGFEYPDWAHKTIGDVLDTVSAQHVKVIEDSLNGIAQPRKQNTMLELVGALESARDYIRDIQEDFHLSDNGILSEIDEAINKHRDAVPVLWPVGTEVRWDAGEDKYGIGLVEYGVIAGPPSHDGYYPIQVGMDTAGKIALTADKMQAVGPAKLMKWDDAGEFYGIYVPEHSDAPVSKWQFIRLMSGDEAAARNLFDTCEWQHPETLIDELGEEFFKGKSGENESAARLRP